MATFERLPKTVLPLKYTLYYGLIDLDTFRFEGTVRYQTTRARELCAAGSNSLKAAAANRSLSREGNHNYNQQAALPLSSPTPRANLLLLQEAVEIEIKEPASEITLHAVDLYISCVEVEQEGNVNEACGIETVVAQQTVSFKFASTIPAGRATLRCKFAGVLNDKLAGFYRSAYKDAEGRTKFLAVTQFEATDARLAFPCWDEPAIKAKFDITLTTDADRVAISNMHAVSVDTRPSRRPGAAPGATERCVRFAETPICSTYLVGFIVGEFDSVSAYTADGVQVNVYTPRGRSAMGQFALNVAVRALDFFTATFGIAYPLRKCDLLSIPDFAAGAMENWGCLTFREAALLIDEAKSSTAVKMRVLRIVCHEVSHQWFGNLCTMSWWTQLWLNEGFARYLEFLAADSIYPEWQMWGIFGKDVASVALALDSLESSHAIEVEVRHPDEINAIFDAISYAKGSCVIKMLAAYLGRDDFFRGLNSYLVAFSYKNAVTEDLWDHMGAASGKPVRQLMTPWTAQVGYPVLTLSEVNGALVARQTRFLLRSGGGDGGPARWDVPVLGAVVAGNQVRELPVMVASADGGSTAEFSAALTALAADACTAKSCFKLNAGQNGFYRVNYTHGQWAALAAAFPALPTADRVGLVSDAFALAQSGHLDVAVALRLAEAARDDDNVTVWAEVSAGVSEMMTIYRGEPFFPALQAWVRQQYGPVAARLGWGMAGAGGAARPVDESTGMLRANVLGMLGSADDAATCEEAARLFEMDGAASVPADVRGAVMRLALRARGEAAWVRIRSMYEKVSSLRPGPTLSVPPSLCPHP
jgi:puromycin-sensitive aminopeptidase